MSQYCDAQRWLPSEADSCRPVGKSKKVRPSKIFPSTKLNYGCLNDNIASPGNNSIL